METVILSEHRRQLLQRLADVEKAASNIRTSIAEEAESQTSIITDFLDHAREQSDLNAHYEMYEKYISERKEILCALDRIKKGTFGECDDCGAKIADKRLLVKPSASLCLECQQSKEAYKGSALARERKLKSSKLLPLTLLNEEAANYEKTNQIYNLTFNRNSIKRLLNYCRRQEQNRCECRQ